MDPDFTLQTINEYLVSDGDKEGAREYAGYLCEWIMDGGFEPDWTRYPLAYAYYLHRCQVNNTCLTIQAWEQREIAITKLIRR